MRIVLVAEDDRELRGMFRTALTLEGYDVQEAEDGIRALRWIDADPPDLIVLDLGLPIVSGQTVLAEIAAHAYTRQIPVVVVTGSRGDHRDLNVACLLRKPVSPDELLQIVERCLRAAAGSGA